MRDDASWRNTRNSFTREALRRSWVYLPLDQWSKATPHQKWQKDQLQICERRTIRCPWRIDKLLCFIFTCFFNIFITGYYDVSTENPATERSELVSEKSRRNRSRISRTENPNKNEDDEALRSELLQAVAEWLQDFKENLVDKNVQPHQYFPSSSRELPMEPRAEVVPGSGKYSIYTHIPKDRNCDNCLGTKTTRASCRGRTGTFVPRAETFGDWVTVVHKVLGEGCESRSNHRYAVVVQDLATQWLQSYPCKTQTSQETQKSLQKFLKPTRKPKVIYTDNSFEFGKSCEELSWNHCTSTPHRSESNGISERAARRVKEGTSAVLLQSGLEGRIPWNATAISERCRIFCLMGRHLMKGGFGVTFNGPVIPFWAMAAKTRNLMGTSENVFESPSAPERIYPSLHETWRFIEDLSTSQSIEGEFFFFFDFEMLDARISVALRKIISISSFSKRVSVEEQRVEKYNRFVWEEGKLLIWSVATFNQPELVIQIKVSRICSVIAHRTRTVKISIQDGIRSHWEQVRCLRRMFSEVCTETDDKVLNNFWRVCDVQPRIELRSRSEKLLKTEEHGKTTYWSGDTRTRNFKAWSVGQRWKRESVESNWTVFKKRFQLFFPTDLILVKEHNHPLLLPEHQRRLTEESLTNMGIWREKVFQAWKAEMRVKFSFEARARRVTSSTLPCAWITSLNTDASVVTSVNFYTLRLVEQPRMEILDRINWITHCSSQSSRCVA